MNKLYICGTVGNYPVHVILSNDDTFMADDIRYENKPHIFTNLEQTKILLWKLECCYLPQHRGGLIIVNKDEYGIFITMNQ